jgi:uncharacterized membrane protein YccF (DUF307 family)
LNVPDAWPSLSLVRLLLNILWIVLGGGLVLCLEYLLVGLLLCLTIVGIPFGLQCFKIAGLALLPFGKDVDPGSNAAAMGPLRVVGNIIWLLVAGIWIFITHVGFAIALAVTIIGIPFAVQHFKLAVFALWPFGRVARVQNPLV